MLALKFKKASGQLDNFMAIPNLKRCGKDKDSFKTERVSIS